MARHWIDELADKLYESLTKRGKEVYVFNGGLSVSGLQHIGRLRGEIILGETLRRILVKRGLKIKQYITLYTQDEWKGKEEQLSQFSDRGEAEKYIGYPLINVPDPRGCHRNWVEHYWEDFGPYIKEFTDGEIEVVTTTDLYRNGLRKFTVKTLEIRDRVREVINKYRGRRKYPENWIPFQPICGRCGRISSTEAYEVVDQEHVKYRCMHCGYEGVASITEGKLSWRVEWVGVWWVLGVDFEPYGKDHAVPGGSRDSCNDLAMNVYGFKPPEGVAFEWVSMRIDGRVHDMTSSGFIGITPREWLEVAHPHIYRFLVLKTPLMKKIVIDLKGIPQYYSQYYRAERIYYGLEEARDEEEKIFMARSYELSYPRGEPPEKPPEQVPYTHLAILSQIVPREMWGTEGIRRLKMSKIIPENPTPYGLERIKELIEKSNNWVLRHGPENLRIKLLKPGKAPLQEIPDMHREMLRRIGDLLGKISVWSEEEIKQAMIEATKDMTPSDRRRFYESFYKLFLGKPYGPRAAPLLAILGREETLKYFEKL